MSEEPVEPVDSALGDLFRAEREAEDPPVGSKARVFERVTASTGIAIGAATLAPKIASSTQWLRLLGTLATGIAIGGGAVAVLREPKVIYVERPVSAPLVAATSTPTVTLPEVVVPPIASAPPIEAARPVPSANTLARERTILDEARAAMRESPAKALEATQRHEREFPRGLLAEEREAIAVQALAKLGRNDEASARGQRFHARYPGSVLAPVINAAIQRSEKKD